MDFFFALLFWFFGAPDGQMASPEMPVMHAAPHMTQSAQIESIRFHRFSQLKTDRKNLIHQQINSSLLQNSIIVVEDTHFKPTK